MSDGHWLHRLDAHGWLAAAQTELAAGSTRTAARRTVIAHARRAGGMALNGVLVAWGEREPAVDVLTLWGRSYVEHLRAVADGVTGPLDPAAREAARVVLATPMAAPPLVSLGKHNPELDALREAVHALLLACASAIDHPHAL